MNRVAEERVEMSKTESAHGAPCRHSGSPAQAPPGPHVEWRASDLTQGRRKGSTGTRTEAKRDVNLLPSQAQEEEAEAPEALAAEALEAEASTEATAAAAAEEERTFITRKQIRCTALH